MYHFFLLLFGRGEAEEESEAWGQNGDDVVRIRAQSNITNKWARDGGRKREMERGIQNIVGLCVVLCVAAPLMGYDDIREGDWVGLEEYKNAVSRIVVYLPT